jgi:recombination protein RecR
MFYASALQNLIDELSKLPSIGPKSAVRLAFYLLEAPNSDIDLLTNALTKLKNSIYFCEICGNITDNKDKVCVICLDAQRDKTKICVIGLAKDIMTIEATAEYNGLYHVLNGVINPMAGIGPSDIRIKELYSRLSNNVIDEVIIALDPNIEGEATSTYLARTLHTLNIKVTKLATGVPIGGDLEYADSITLTRAIEQRIEI